MMDSIFPVNPDRIHLAMEQYQLQVDESHAILQSIVKKHISMYPIIRPLLGKSSTVTPDNFFTVYNKWDDRRAKYVNDVVYERFPNMHDVFNYETYPRVWETFDDDEVFCRKFKNSCKADGNILLSQSEFEFVLRWEKASPFWYTEFKRLKILDKIDTA